MSEQLSRFDPALTQYTSVTTALNQHKIRVQAVSGANASLQPVEFVLEKGTTVTALKWTKNVSEASSRRKKTKTQDAAASSEEYLVSVGTNRGDILTFSPAQAKLVSALRGGHSLPVADFDVDASSGTTYSLDNRGLLNVWKGSSVERSVDKTGAKLVAVLPSGNVLLATHNIAVYGPHGDDSSAVSFDAPLFDIPSHTSTVTELCVRGDLVAAVAGDRLINVVNVAQKKIVLVLMAESGAHRVSMNGDILSAITEGGSAEFFQLAQTNGATPSKKNKRKSIVTKSSFASLDLERGNKTAGGPNLAIDAVALTAKEAYYSYTERAQAQFAHVTLSSLETEPSMTVVHDPKNAANHYTEERTVPVSYNEEDAIIAAGDDYSQLEKDDESDDDESATLAEKMDALKRENKTSKGGLSGTAPPTMGSLSTVLTQAIKSDDDDLLESCLLFRDEEGIKSTVQRLNSSLAVLLLERLAAKMTAQPSRGRQFNAWIKWVMVAHGGYLVTVPKLLVTVSRLHKALNTRVNTLDRLLALEGRLEMLEAQMELRNASHGANDDDEESDSEVEFVEGEEDIEDEDDEDDMSEIMAMGEGEDEDVEMEEDEEEEEESEDEDEDEIALPDSDEEEMKQVLNKKRGKQ
ncbi:U3 small nucleolar RNA-associated protein 5 [Yarrowia sp. C11]|nr:U3 small nucleolar RNA-associated protein 5 [Yarrowia sp. C11]KAG5370482.1 U3 small nucleolar RNA-associated protein 5 [Yarrowia sp. E02]